MEHNEQFMVGSILNDMSDGVIVIGADNTIIMHNRAAQEILGMPESALNGKNIAEIMQNAEDNEFLFSQINEAVQNHTKFIKPVPYFRNGEMLYLRLKTDDLGSGSERTGVIAQISDITEATLLFIANKRLANQVTNLMNSFVEVMVTAIEEESAYNANHTKSMVQYAKQYLAWLEENGTLGLYTSENTGPFLMSIWLHDIGKLPVPQEILDKPSRLGGALSNVLHRIETTELMLKIKMLEHPEQQQETEAQQRELLAAKELILSANTAGFLEDETIAKLQTAAEFPCLAADGSTLPLLNESELESISVQRGTLTAAERKIIESHVTLTRKLLSKVEFRGDYKRVPEWAAGHHEMIDGSGYPNHLRGDEIPWEIRLLSILDIYDALTAEDRPYKPPMPSEKAFAILRDMAANGKLDSRILESFYESGAWKRSA